MTRARRYLASNDTSPWYTQGLPHAIADVADSSGDSVAFSNHRDSLLAVTNVLVDGGYTGQQFADAIENVAIENVLGATVETTRRNELRTFAVTPKRWVVECLSA